MRYRITDAGAGAPVQGAADFVTSTVWLTLLVGITMLVMGFHGRQRWLRFWGALTCACCFAYLGRGWFGWA